MVWLSVFALFALLAYVLPNTFKYLFVAPLIGFCLGGLCWGLSLLIFGAGLSLQAGGIFFVGGIVVAEICAFFID